MSAQSLLIAQISTSALKMQTAKTKTLKMLGEVTLVNVKTVSMEMVSLVNQVSTNELCFILGESNREMSSLVFAKKSQHD